MLVETRGRMRCFLIDNAPVVRDALPLRESARVPGLSTDDGHFESDVRRGLLRGNCFGARAVRPSSSVRRFATPEEGT